MPVYKIIHKVIVSNVLFALFRPDGGHHLSILYGIIIVLLGLTFPIREALQEQWLTTYMEAVRISFSFVVLKPFCNKLYEFIDNLK